MFEQTGFEKGERDGRSDAMAGKRYRLRPDWKLSIISARYLESYSAAYSKGFHDAKRTLTQQELYEARRSHDNNLVLTGAIAGSPSKPFDKGWNDGFSGGCNSVSKFQQENEIDAYNRGYKLGARDRDFARAKALREKKTRGHDRNESQAEQEREI